MTSRDELSLAARQRIKNVVAQVYSRVAAAEMLLAQKAARSPDTAEGHAHKLLYDARARIDAWLAEAGAAVGLDVGAQTREGDNGKKTQTEGAGPRPDLRAGGEAQTGPAPDKVPS